MPLCQLIAESLCVSADLRSVPFLPESLPLRVTVTGSHWALGSPCTGGREQVGHLSVSLSDIVLTPPLRGVRAASVNRWEESWHSTWSASASEQWAQPALWSEL